MDVMILSALIHPSCLGIIRKAEIEIGVNLFPDFRIADRNRDFHSALRVSRHEVSRGNIEFFIAAGAELVNSRMFQISADDGANMHVVGLALDLGKNAGNAADEQIDLHSRIRCLVEFFDHFLIGDGIQLAGDYPLLFLRGFPLDQRDYGLLQRDRRNQEIPVAAVELADHHVAEEVHRISDDARAGGEIGKVGIQPGCILIEVSGRDQGDMAEILSLHAGNQADLGMDLVILESVHDRASRIHQFLGIVDVVLLVKARLELDQHVHFLAVLRRKAEIIHEPCLAGKTIDRDLDRDHRRIGGCLLDQKQERIHGFVRIGKQHILLLDLRKQLLAVFERSAEFRRIRRILESCGMFGRKKICDLEHVLPIQRHRCDIDHPVFRLDEFGQILRHRRAELLRHLHPDKILPLSLLQHFHHAVAIVEGIVKLIIIHIHIRVPDHREFDLVAHRRSLEHAVHIVENDVFHMNEADDILRSGQTDDMRKLGRHRNQCKGIRIVVADETCRIDRSRLQGGKRMTAVDDLGAEHRRDNRAEEFLQPGAVFLGALFQRQIKDSLPLQISPQFPEDIFPAVA